MSNNLEEELREHQKRPEYKQLGGWLLLPALGVLFAPMRNLLAVLEVAALMGSETWPILTTPGAEGYHKLWLPLCVLELAGNIVLLGVSITLAVCFGMKKRFVPRFLIGWLLTSVAFHAVLVALFSQIPGAQVAGRVEGIGWGVVSCGIWIPYFLVSKRVKGTFVK